MKSLLLGIVLFFSYSYMFVAQLRPLPAWFFLPSIATDIAVPSGGNLQAAINASVPGDRIVLQAGATFRSPQHVGFVFGNKGTSSEFITVTTSDPSLIPAKLRAYPTNYSFTDPSKYRVTTAESAGMPKIVASDGFAAPINFPHGAHHWKFVGIEVTNDTPFSNSLISSSTAPETSLDQFAHDIAFELCFVRPKEETGDINVNYQRRSVEKGITFNGHNLSVRKSALQGFTGKSPDGSYALDTNCLMYVTGLGNVIFEDSLCEGQSNNLWLGGGGPQLVPDNHTATITNPTVTSGTFSQTTDLAVGDLFGVYLQKIASRMVTNTDDPDAKSPTPILSGWGVGKVQSISGNNITNEHLTSAYDYRRFEIKFNTGVTGGTFTLTFHGQTTAPIAFSSTRAVLATNVRVALENLSNVAPADIAHVSGESIYVEAPTYGLEILFANSFIQSLPSEFTANGSGLTGSGSVAMRVEPHWSEYYSRVHPADAPEPDARVRWKGMVPKGFTIKRSIIAKHKPWYDFLGPQKGFGEAKSGTDYLFEGVIFHGQPTGMIWEVKNQGGDSPWSTISRVIMRSCLWSNNGSSVALALTDGTNRTTPGTDFWIDNSLFIGPGANPTGEETWAGNSTTGGSNVRLTHNTMLLSGRVVFAVCGIDGPEVAGFSQLKQWRVDDNIILQRGSFFQPVVESRVPPYIFGDVRDCWPDMVAQRNVVIDDRNLGNPSGFFTIHPNNYKVSSIAAVGFVNAPTSLDQTGNYQLRPDSAFKGKASDGGDPGYNHQLFVSHLGFDPFTGAIAQPTPTATPTPISTPTPGSSPSPTPTSFAWEKLPGSPDAVQTLAFVGYTLYVGTMQKGIYAYDGIRWTQLNAGLPSTPLWVGNFFVTKQGSLLASMRFSENPTYSSTYRLSNGVWTESANGRNEFASFYANDRQGNILMSTNTAAVMRSVDDGRTFEQFTQLSPVDGSQSTSFSIGTGVDGTLYVYSHDTVSHYSTDDGKTWTPLRSDRSGPWGNQTALTSNAQGQMIAATGFGGIYRNGGTLQSPAIKLEANLQVNNDAGAHSLIRLADGTLASHFIRIHCSKDGGDTWALCDAGIPTGTTSGAQNIQSLHTGDLAQGPDGRVYVGFLVPGFGIYRTGGAISQPTPSPTPIATPFPSPAPTPTPLPTPPSGQIQLSGSAFSIFDGSRFDFTKVVLSDANGNKLKEFFTETGTYSFNVAAGSYQISIEQAGYNSSPGRIYLNNADSDTGGLSILNFTLGPSDWFKAGPNMCVPRDPCPPGSTPSPTVTPTPVASPSPSVTPTPTPVPTPIATPTPTPLPSASPSPTPLPFCVSGQRPGNPPVCRCRNGFQGNSGKCK